jgi:hypothetical protein
MSDIAKDPHYAARNMIQVVGNTPMQELIAALSKLLANSVGKDDLTIQTTKT